MFVSFHAPDSVGHARGVEDPEYEASLIQIDGFVGTIAARLKELGAYDSTYWIVSADHGQTSVQQQMSLDLSVSGGPIQHFDSGLIAGGGGFPKIDITISLHQNTACRDTMMRVEASPYYTASGIATGANGNSAALDRVSPNPFGGQVKLRLTLAHPGPVEIVVYDLGGRIVRSLADGAWFTAGEHTLSWDGRCDSGASSSAGVYFVRAQAGGDRFVRRVVKVE